jgi:hypothetical protein
MRKVFMVFLILCMVVNSVMPAYSKKVYALDLPEGNESEIITEKPTVNYPITTDPDFDYSQIELSSEVFSKRTENTKLFLREDGSYLVALYDDVVHYKKNGEYFNIDNSMVYDKNLDEYSNKENQFSINFPNKLDYNRKIKMCIDEYSVAWSVLSIYNTDINITDKVQKSNNKKELINITQEVSYLNIMSGVDLKYYVNGSNVKEDIVLNKYIEEFTISFEYLLQNLTLVNKNGFIYFVNKTGNTIYNFDELYAIDNNGKMTNDIKIIVTEKKKNLYQLTISVADEWLKTASYPVIIDPSINSSTQTLDYYDTYVYDGNPNNNYSTRSTMYLSSDIFRMNGLVCFNLPGIIMDKKITYSYLQLTAYQKTPDRVLGVYKNLYNFTPNEVTWNTKPSCDDEMTDYHIVGESNSYTFNITKAVQEWQATGNTITSGFTIKDKDDYGGLNSVFSIENSDLSKKPIIEIGYIDPEGIKDYWTYNSQQVGEFSTGYVSDYTGMLNVLRNDITFETDKQTLSLNFAYNIMNRDENIGYGSGWNIVYNTYIKEKTDLGLFYTQDYTGNKVYYHEIDCGSRFNPINPDSVECYLAEDGSGNILVREFTDQNFVGQYILAANGIKFIFTLVDSDEKAYLTSIINTKTNTTLEISRNAISQGKVTKITDSSGNEINITYGQYGIVKAELYIYQGSGVDSYKLEEIEYGYEYVGYSQYSIHTVNYKKEYVENNGCIIDDILEYDYDNNGRLTNARIVNQVEILYTFNINTNKVIKIKSYFGAKIFSEIDYEYSLKKTTVTNQNDDYIIYKFDDFGHTINILDSEGNIQSFRYYNLFSNLNIFLEEITLLDGIPNYYKNNIRVSQSAPQSKVFNLVSNHSFEYINLISGSSWIYESDLGSAINDNHNSGQHYQGNYSAKIDSDFSNNGHFYQSITLDEGVYTLTGYIKNETSLDEGNYSVCIDILGEDFGGGRELVDNNSVWTKVTITFGINNDDTQVFISLINHSIGEAFFDNIELYEGFVVNKTNIISNASFEMAYISGEFPGWNFSDSNNVYRTSIDYGLDTIHNEILGDYAVGIDGSALENRYAMTSIPNFQSVLPDDESNSLSIGAWSKSEGTPNTTSAGELGDFNFRHYRLRIDFLSEEANVNDFNYYSFWVGSEYLYFDSAVEGWQYQCEKFNIPLDEDGVMQTNYLNILLEYKGEGSVYFDGLQIFYDHSYNYYEYDDYGNIVLINVKRFKD